MIITTSTKPTIMITVFITGTGIKTINLSINIFLILTSSSNPERFELKAA